MVANWKMTLIITFVLPFVGLQAYAQMLFLKGVNKNAKVYKMDEPLVLFG
jgi:ATP-binding cassette subfamily B (MDR/TAP) protein 1